MPLCSIPRLDRKQRSGRRRRRRGQGTATKPACASSSQTANAGQSAAKMSWTTSIAAGAHPRLGDVALERWAAALLHRSRRAAVPPLNRLWVARCWAACCLCRRVMRALLAMLAHRSEQVAQHASCHRSRDEGESDDSATPSNSSTTPRGGQVLPKVARSRSR